MDKPYEETEINSRDWNEMFSFHRDLYGHETKEFYEGRVLAYLRFLFNASEVEYVKNCDILTCTVRYKPNKED